MYKKITDVISAEISEARNSPAKSGRIILAGKQDFDIGEIIIISQGIENSIKNYSLRIMSVEYENDNTILTCEDLLKQLFSCIIPYYEPVSGNAVNIIKELLNEASNQQFINIYINDENLDDTVKIYTSLNIANRYLGEIFQDICNDISFVMWVGYDEINDKPNAFFFKQASEVETLDLAFREGHNIISEKLKQSSLDEIINYIFLYYYPDKYPADEHWTETCQMQKIVRAKGNNHLGDAGITDNVFHLGDVVVWADAIAHLTADLEEDDTVVYVDSTAGFDSSGQLTINGASGSLVYSSKTGTSFNLTNPSDINVKKENSFVYQYIYATYDDELEQEAVTKAEWFVLYTYLVQGKVSHIHVECWGGSAGTQVLVSLMDGLVVIGQKVFSGMPGELDADVDWNIPTSKVYSLLVSSANAGGVGHNFYPGMGQCASQTGNLGDSEIKFWAHIGSPMKKSYGIGDYVISDTSCGIDHTGPDTQPAVAIIQTIEVGTSLWSGGYSYNKYEDFKYDMQVIAQEGYDSLRLEYAGTYELLSIAVNISIYQSLNFRYKGNLTKIELFDSDTNYYSYIVIPYDVWTAKLIPLSSMTKIGNPLEIHKIKLTTTDRAFVDSLYFLGNVEGTLLIIKDDISLGKYGQKPFVFYAKGVSDSSIAISLGNILLGQKKEPSWGGALAVKDDVRLNAFSKVRTIIPTKEIDTYFDILEITHSSEGIAHLTVGYKEIDLGLELAKLKKEINNIELTIGDTTPQDTGSLPYTNHAGKHQDGGADEINIEALKGILYDEQKSNWAIVTDGPSSSVVDIDSAVALKHSHANKALLDTYTQAEADLADAVSKKHSHTNKTQLDLLTDGDHDVRTDNPHATTKTHVGLSEVANLKCNYAATAAPTVNNDSSQGYAIGSRWFDVTADLEYVCLDATVGSAVWKLTT